ncbi:protein of unknown function [Nitrospira defluvii]|uniref:Uncharacterized protein n=1 Tax=Nitrospira defluvii TaxID=330214 RepID=D8PAH0_9BACT|nr:protein of unknown function [Nitrospira defluvii]
MSLSPTVSPTSVSFIYITKQQKIRDRSWRIKTLPKPLWPQKKEAKEVASQTVVHHLNKSNLTVRKGCNSRSDLDTIHAISFLWG